MGHRLVEEEMERQNKEKYPGSFDVGQSTRDNIAVKYEMPHSSIAAPTKYKLDVTMIHDLEDVKDILEALNLTLIVYKDGASPVQKRLIDNKTFKKQ